MSFWSSQTLRNRLPNLIEPYSEAAIDTASYNLALGNEVFVTPLANDNPNERTKVSLEVGQDFEIPPSRFAFLITQEEITVPGDALAFISLKFKQKAKGLVNVSGFHVDPGYKGKLVFAVFNAGGAYVRVECGQPMFSIWYADIDEVDDKPFGRSGYSHLASSLIDLPSMGDAVSLPLLKNTVDDLKKEVASLDAKISRVEPRALIIYAILTAIVFSIVSFFAREWLAGQLGSDRTGVAIEELDESAANLPAGGAKEESPTTN